MTKRRSDVNYVGYTPGKHSVASRGMKPRPSLLAGAEGKRPNRAKVAIPDPRMNPTSGATVTVTAPSTESRWYRPFAHNPIVTAIVRGLYTLYTSEAGGGWTPRKAE